jgi:ankyrin repeat protein
MSFTRYAGVGYEAVQKLSVRQISDYEQYTRWRSIYDPDRPWKEEPDIPD